MHYSIPQIVFIWIIGGGILSWLLKDIIVAKLQSLAWRRLAKFYLIVIPLILIEEFLTCETPYLSCLKITLPAFCFLLLFVYWIGIFTRMPYWLTTILFGLFGWYDEFILVGRLYRYPSNITLILTPITILIYMLLAFLPSYYLSKTRARD